MNTNLLAARRAVCLATALLALLASAGVARAQSAQADSFFRRERFLQEDIRRRLDADRPADQKVLLEYGGYIIPEWQEYDDLQDEANLRRIDLRLWGQVVIDDVHRVYARMRLVWTQFGPGDSPFGWKSDLDGPKLDQLFYELWVSKAAEKYFGQKWPVDARLTLGRQFVEFGHGLALSTTLEGGTLRLETGQWRLTALLANTVRSDNNIDRSPPVADHMDRLFAGFELECLALSRHRPFFYYFAQSDNTHEKPKVDQNFEYDSQYIGFGSTGELVDRLRYATEAVFELGTGHNALPPVGQRVAGGPLHNVVRAFAFDQLFEYYFRGPHQPVISAEYALATGDDDRTFAAGTSGGNTDRRDNAFLGFGYLNTGLSFAPGFTNLQFVRLGGRIKPLPKVKCLENLEVGTDFFMFWKQKHGAPIDDFRATTAAHDLGHEVDIYANWRVLSDVALTVRYGRFWSGDAFPDEEKRDYLFAGLLYSF